MPTIKYTKEQTMIYNTTNKYWATQTTNKTRVNSDAPEWLGVSAVLETPVIWLLNDTHITGYWVGHKWI